MDELLEQTKVMYEHKTKKKLSGFGDGTIWNAIVDWIKSEEGQAFISMMIEILIQALLAAL